MPVRFAERAEVIEFEPAEGDQEWRRPFDNYNLEYKRETRLFSLVLAWKQAQKRVTPHAKIKNKSLKSILGKHYAKKVFCVYGAKTVAGLEESIKGLVLTKWPLLEMRHTQRDYDLSSVIVLSVVAETLFEALDFRLDNDDDRAKFFSIVFHVSQGILNIHFP